MQGSDPTAACLLAPILPPAAEDRGILDDRGNLVEEDDVVLENILAVSGTN